MGEVLINDFSYLYHPINVICMRNFLKLKTRVTIFMGVCVSLFAERTCAEDLYQYEDCPAVFNLTSLNGDCKKTKILFN